VRAAIDELTEKRSPHTGSRSRIQVIRKRKGGMNCSNASRSTTRSSLLPDAGSRRVHPNDVLAFGIGVDKIVQTIRFLEFRSSGPLRANVPSGTLNALVWLGDRQAQRVDYAFAPSATWNDLGRLVMD